MRSSRNPERAAIAREAGCNRLENAVKPQPFNQDCVTLFSCNRLENAVKPQLEIPNPFEGARCNRLENAVKPQ